MYSLGVSFYEMALDELPFDADFFVEVQNKMVEAKGSKDIFTSPHIGRLPEKDRDDFQDLIGGLMNMTPNGRMKASEIKGHPFFAELKPIAPAPQRPTA
jgi:serine/threonine protein kinase